MSVSTKTGKGKKIFPCASISVSILFLLYMYTYVCMCVFWGFVCVPYTWGCPGWQQEGIRCHVVVLCRWHEHVCWRWSSILWKSSKCSLTIDSYFLPFFSSLKIHVFLIWVKFCYLGWQCSSNCNKQANKYRSVVHRASPKNSPRDSENNTGDCCWPGLAPGTWR